MYSIFIRESSYPLCKQTQEIPYRCIVFYVHTSKAPPAVLDALCVGSFSSCTKATYFRRVKMSFIDYCTKSNKTQLNWTNWLKLMSSRKENKSQLLVWSSWLTDCLAGELSEQGEQSLEVLCQCAPAAAERIHIPRPPRRRRRRLRSQS